MFSGWKLCKTSWLKCDMYCNHSMIVSAKAPVVQDWNRCTLLTLRCSFYYTTIKIARCNLSTLLKYNCFRLYSKRIVSRIGRNYFYLLKKHFTYAECATMPTNSRYSIKAFWTFTRASLLVTEAQGIPLLEKWATWSSIKFTSGENITKILCCSEDRHKVFFSLSTTLGINAK